MNSESNSNSYFSMPEGTNTGTETNSKKDKKHVNYSQNFNLKRLESNEINEDQFFINSRFVDVEQEIDREQFQRLRSENISEFQIVENAEEYDQFRKTDKLLK